MSLTGLMPAPEVLLVAAWAVYLASFIGMVKVMPCGFGKHLWSVTAEGLQCYQNMLLFLGVSYFWPPTLAKLSLIVLYHRINPRFKFRLALYAIAFICIVYTLVFSIILSGPCNPLTTGNTTCLNNLALAQAILNISTDGVLIIMPVVTLWDLQMERTQKIAVGCILALGSGAVIASCVRIAYVRAMLNNPDVLYTQGSAAVWSAVEINIGILCNCLAMLKPFVRRHMPWLKSLIGIRSSKEDHGYVDSGGKGKVGENTSRRESRKSGGRYELHSFGRDRGYGHGMKGEGDGVMIEAGVGGISSSGSEDSLHEDGLRHKGILVTTTVAMGRSSAGDVSEDDILPRERSNSFAAISSGGRNARLAPVPAARIAR
ncbi:hypothetical protein N0V93_009049 [Gnomoniopsis smithogilvyi]|uniref:Rhodopsin domain-containing protein n=1 Tax=Gnomoniopsis smithogilvyi TaxID=1191159 RepID=A0A9W9CSF5_9PEZI|nr:hypothetical protein N0V93_009049 [Gnomoniopsis smithogilvyi]